MATRSKQAFLLPDEFIQLMDEFKKSLGLEVVLQHGNEPRKVWDGGRATVSAATRVFLADPRTIDATSLAESNSPGRLGWVNFDVPIVEGDRLFAVQLAARGDWFDKEAGIVRESKEALKLFDKVWKLVVPWLAFPVVAKNIITGAEASYPSIGYSAGAAAWSAREGKLLQRGVDNIEFSLPGTPGLTPSSSGLPPSPRRPRKR